ncbi:MAG: AAA family ATPase, partial [Myxococcales bacterium]|nr:AAA family ATPase [Myxococcales bacterium]
GELEERKVTLKSPPGPSPTIEIFSRGGTEDMGIQFPGNFNPFGQQPPKERELTIRQAREQIRNEEANRMMDMEKVVHEAKERAQSNGIVFIDEIDKVAGGSSQGHGPDISREGVQRDLLPIVEGSTVQTKQGPVRTDHILFIAAGAFHDSKPSDLIPELQGRFPIRVELASLTRDDLVQILTEPQNSLVRQYAELLKTEGITLEFKQDGVQAVADIAAAVNERMADIGARRLHTVMEKLLEDLSFDAPDMGQATIVVDRNMVEKRLGDLVEDQDLSQYIL